MYVDNLKLKFFLNIYHILLPRCIVNDLICQVNSMLLCVQYVIYFKLILIAYVKWEEDTKFPMGLFTNYKLKSLITQY